MSKRKIVLYIDDDEASREAVIERLEGHDIRAVGSKIEFWRLLKEEKLIPDLFLIDWILEGDTTAEDLIRKTQTEYPDIPRVVLTAGQGLEGSARIIADLQCGYIEKGAGFDAIVNLIDRTINRTKDSTEVQATAAPGNFADSIEEIKNQYGSMIDELERSKRELAEREKALKTNLQELNERKEKLENENNKLELENKSLEEQRQAVQTQMGVAEEQVRSLEVRRAELEEKNKQDKFFFERFLNVSKSIVDQRLSLRQVADRLLQLILEYSDCSVGIIILFDEKGGLLIDDDDKPRTLTAYLGTPISLSDVGDTDQLRTLVKENGSRIVNNFKTDRLTDHTFVTTNLAGINKRSHLLLTPIELNNVKGALLLFDKKNGTPFDEEDRQKIEQLPLADILNAAQEMPFRSYDQHGFVKFVLNKVHPRPWEVKPRLLSTAIEILKAIIYLISVLVIVLPGYHIIKYLIDRWRHGSEVNTIESVRIEPPHMMILGNIELLLMLLTFVLFSLGLVILFEPKYAQGLPRWMVRFTRLSTLEGTMLRLVVIILAVDVLGRFLASHKRGFTDTAPELFIVAISICLITIAVGVFIKYFLHESESPDDDGAS